MIRKDKKAVCSDRSESNKRRRFKQKLSGNTTGGCIL
jgi:hypothetical protein